jgi:hypothetical protein
VLVVDGLAPDKSMFIGLETAFMAAWSTVRLEGQSRLDRRCFLTNGFLVRSSMKDAIPTFKH